MTRIAMMLNRPRPSRCMVRMVAIALLASAMSVFAQNAEVSASALADRYQGAIKSKEIAERALTDVGQARSLIQEQFAANERKCHDDFFATSCIEGAQERRRAALEDVRKVEVEANAFLRQARVKERDQALEEKRVARERKEAESLQHEQAKGPVKKQSAEPKPAHPAPAAGEPDPRVVRHQAKLKRIEEQERVDAQKRADNVAAYEQRVKASQDRQRQVEEKKREKERERASR